MSVRPHIVIAEDDEQSRQLLRLVVRRCHPAAAITAVDNGLAALQVCTSQVIDLLISDNQMPGMPGIELAQHLRARQINIPIILLSGDTRVLADVRLPTRTRLISKPVDLLFLMQLLKQQLATDRVL